MHHIKLSIVATIPAFLALTITPTVAVTQPAKKADDNKQQYTDSESTTSARRLPLISSSFIVSTSPNAVANQLKNTEVGYFLFYPRDWQRRGQVIATQFANNAQCEAVEVVDFQPPPESGPSAIIRRSFVQICAKSLTDSLSLDEFMHRTYMDLLGDQFQKTKFAGMPAYRAKNKDQGTIVFLQTKKHRIQIIASVTADFNKHSQRRSQAKEILESFSIIQTKRGD